MSCNIQHTPATRQKGVQNVQTAHARFSLDLKRCAGGALLARHQEILGYQFRKVDSRNVICSIRSGPMTQHCCRVLCAANEWFHRWFSISVGSPSLPRVLFLFLHWCTGEVPSTQCTGLSQRYAVHQMVKSTSYHSFVVLLRVHSQSRSECGVVCAVSLMVFVTVASPRAYVRPSPPLPSPCIKVLIGHSKLDFTFSSSLSDRWPRIMKDGWDYTG